MRTKWTTERQAFSDLRFMVTGRCEAAAVVAFEMMLQAGRSGDWEMR
jgi:hypothetical protein